MAAFFLGPSDGKRIYDYDFMVGWDIAPSAAHTADAACPSGCPPPQQHFHFPIPTPTGPQVMNPTNLDEI